MPFVVFNKKSIAQGNEDPSDFDCVLDLSRPSILGNPCVLGKDGSRQVVIERYRRWLWQVMQSDNEPVLREMRRLADLDRAGKRVPLAIWQDKRPEHTIYRRPQGRLFVICCVHAP